MCDREAWINMNYKIRRVSIVLLILSLCALKAAPSAGASVHDGTTERVSIATDGTQGNGDSGWAQWEDYTQQEISADGRYVAFMSEATNLVAGDTNGFPDIFVHDRETGETIRVSVASNGAQGNAKSVIPSISAYGRYVAFESDATNLVANDTNGETDVFVHDRNTGVTTLVSVSSDEAQGNGMSYYTSISADGRYVSFSSWSSNLVSGDTNGYDDIFVRDCTLGVTERVSLASNGTQANLWSDYNHISADGRMVAFRSAAYNLVDNDTNNIMDIFVHDRLTHQTVRVSVASDGTEGNGDVDQPSISANNRFVVFASVGDNLVDADTNNTWDVFVRNLATGETERVSISGNGSEGNGWSSYGSISADGRYVAFVANASNLVPGDLNSRWDVFVHDRYTGRTTRESVAYDGSESNSGCDVASISMDERFVSFVTFSSNLVLGDTNDFMDVFVHDRGELFQSFLPLIRN
jgi:Tol biopolymer transport system component